MTDTANRPSATRLPAAERRRQLLGVALEVFAANGFHETSMNEVAEAAGVTKPVLYQHFASKEALYSELVDEIGAQLERAIFEAAAAAEGPRQQVESGFRAYFRWAIGQGAAFQVLFSDRNRADAQLVDAIDRVEGLVADRVASLIEPSAARLVAIICCVARRPSSRMALGSIVISPGVGLAAPVAARAAPPASARPLYSASDS